MANKFSQVIIAGLILAMGGLPAIGQEAAFDDSPRSGSGGGLMQAPGQQQIQARPQQAISTSAAADNHSNLRHWSRFSCSSAKPLFVRVAPGTKVQGASEVSHYVKPTCVAPGKAACAAKNQNGPVKRYLAYNVPISTNAKPRINTAQAVVGTATPKPSCNKAKQIKVLGYGNQHIIGTYTVSNHARPHAPAISCYASYH
ncbi:MAG: hypothetical protein K2X81_02420 [Candidatus Obscuribacterales bacterium]|nr:hypothetical protein [Candidatus Obscuribacterales bacterium]